MKLRKHCVVCLSPAFNSHKTITQFPIFMGAVETQLKDDIYADQKWASCSNCGCVQLLELVPYEILYQNSHNHFPTGPTWALHNETFVDFISSHIDNSESVLEVGAAHGYIAEKLGYLYPQMKYTIVEPSPGKFPEKVHLVKGYIEDNLDLINDAHCLIHSHVLEHIYEPRLFFAHTSYRMREGSRLIFSVPNLPKAIELRGANALNFEHTYMLDESVVEYFAKIHNMNILAKHYFKDHSIFFALEKRGASSAVTLPNLAYWSIEFYQFWEEIKEFALSVGQRQQFEVISPCYIFGAHIFSQVLLWGGVHENGIVGVLDNSPSKQEKRLYGTNLSIFPPNVILKDFKPHVIVLGGYYQSEIERQLREINPTVQIITIKSTHNNVEQNIT